jgi:hypothetical protein
MASMIFFRFLHLKATFNNNRSSLLLKSSSLIPPEPAVRKKPIAFRIFDLPALFSPINACNLSILNS